VEADYAMKDREQPRPISDRIVSPAAE